jgi:hypothetical protein
MVARTPVIVTLYVHCPSCSIRRNVCDMTVMCLPMCVNLFYRPPFVTEPLGSSSKQINNYYLHRAHVSACSYVTWSHFLPVASRHLPHKDTSPASDQVTTQRPGGAVPPIPNLATLSYVYQCRLLQ